MQKGIIGLQSIGVWNVAWRVVCVTDVVDPRLTTDGGQSWALPLQRQRVLGIATRGDFRPEEALFADLGSVATERPCAGCATFCNGCRRFTLDAGLTVSRTSVSFGHLGSPVSGTLSQVYFIIPKFPARTISGGQPVSIFFEEDGEELWEVYKVHLADWCYLLLPDTDGVKALQYLTKGSKDVDKLNNEEVTQALVNGVPLPLGHFLARAFADRYEDREKVRGAPWGSKDYPAAGFANRHGVFSMKAPSRKVGGLPWKPLKSVLVNTLKGPALQRGDAERRRVLRIAAEKENVYERERFQDLATTKNKGDFGHVGARLTCANVPQLLSVQEAAANRGRKTLESFKFENYKVAYLSTKTATQMKGRVRSERRKADYDKVEFIGTHPVTYKTSFIFSKNKNEEVALWEHHVIKPGEWRNLPSLSFLA